MGSGNAYNPRSTTDTPSMSVILEFTIDADEFSLGRVLSGPLTMQYVCATNCSMQSVYRTIPR